MAFRETCRVLAALAFVFVALGTSVPAAAQSDSKEAARQALEIIREANESFDAEDFEAAMSGYEEAYALYPDPVLLYRLGVTAEKLEQPRAAIGYYRQFIEALPDDPTAQKTAERLPELAEGLAPLVRVDTSPGGARVYIGTRDSAAVGVTPLEYEAGEGEQTFIIVLEGHRPVERVVELEAAQIEEISLELEPLGAKTSVPGDALVVRDDAATGEEPGLATWGYIAAGSGAAILATGIAFNVLSLNKADDFNTYDTRAPGASEEDRARLRDTSENFYATSLALYVIGGLTTAAGVTLILLDNVGGEEETALRLDMTPLRDGAFVGVSGSF